MTWAHDQPVALPFSAFRAYGSTVEGRFANRPSPIGGYGCVASLRHRCIVLIDDHRQGQWGHDGHSAIGTSSIAAFQHGGEDDIR
jgi:hypothetical protein